MIDHCIALFKKRRQEKLYRVYITDGLKAISETLCKRYGGTELQIRYYDLIEQPTGDDRSADEIKNDIMAKYNALGGEDDGTFVRLDGEDHA